MFDYDWPANWSYGFGNPWMKRPFCQCPQGKKLDENGHCVITTNNPKIKSCTDSGGNWTTIPSCCGKEYQKCGSESVV
ncbi:hypothetical protein NL529_31755, partial [Klebsiella pneumoniae]|nr:hypothetical protein [Klebsiella pneumoniae]